MSFLISTVEGGNFRLSLADGGELEVTTGGGGGGVVSSVTSGGAPITVAPATGAVVVGIDASYPAVADFWPYDRSIPKGVATPTLSQANQTDATVPPTIVAHASNAFAGSGNSGGAWNFVNGITDGAAAPARFRIFQARTGEGANNSIMAEFFFNEGTAVQSVGFGDPTHTTSGTQVVLQGAGNSVVSHATIGMFSLDNATTGQAFIQMHDVDGLGLLPGAFLAQYDVFTSAAESDVGLYLSRRQNTVGSGGSSYMRVVNGTPGTPVVRYDLLEAPATGGGTAAQANIALYDPSGVTAAAKSFLKFPYGDGTLNPGQGIITTRNKTNSGDITYLRRVLDITFWNDAVDAAQTRFEANTSVFFENGTTGGGWQFQQLALGVQFQISTDAARTITSHGDVANGHQGQQTQKYGINVASTAGVIVADITLPEGLGPFCVVTVTAEVQGVDTVTGDAGTAKLTRSFTANAGVATLLTGADGPTDTGHSAAAAAFAASLTMVAAAAGHAHVLVDTWGANTIAFVAWIKMNVNTGTA